jgi:hypothetical protein
MHVLFPDHTSVRPPERTDAPPPAPLSGLLTPFLVHGTAASPQGRAAVSFGALSAPCATTRSASSQYTAPMPRFRRLLTALRRPWRVVPELADLSDREGYALVRRIRLWRTIGLVLVVTIFFLVFPTLGLLVHALSDRLAPRTGAVPGTPVLRAVADILLALLVVVAALAAALTPYFLILRWALRRTVGADTRVVCPFCGYALAGAPMLAGKREPGLICPECGAVVPLRSFDLRPEDILAGRRDRAGTEANPAGAGPESRPPGPGL